MTEFLVASDDPDQKDKCPISACPRIFKNRKQLVEHAFDLHKIHVCVFCDDDILQFQTAIAYENHKKRKHANKVIFIDIDDISDDCDYSQQQPRNDESGENLVKTEPIDVESVAKEEQNVAEEKKDEQCEISEEVDTNNKSTKKKDRHICTTCKKSFSSLGNHLKVCRKRSNQDDDGQKSQSSSDTVLAKNRSSNKCDSIGGARDDPGLPSAGASRRANHVKITHGDTSNSCAPVNSDQLPVLDRYSPARSESTSTKRRSPSSHESLQDGRKVAKVHPQRMNDEVEEGDDSELICNDCGQPCKSKADLMNHLLSHNKEKAKGESEKLKPFNKQPSLSCPICDVQFVERSDLLMHLPAEHPDMDDPDMEYECPNTHCDETFVNAFELYVHFRAHQVSAISVQENNVVPPLPSNKREAILKWIEETNNSHPFIFNDNTENDNELPVSEEKPKQERSRHSGTICSEGSVVGCREDGCEKSFPTVAELRIHRESVHPNSKIIHCSYPNCDVPFNKSYLKRHMKECHQITSEN